MTHYSLESRFFLSDKLHVIKNESGDCHRRIQLFADLRAMSFYLSRKLRIFSPLVFHFAVHSPVLYTRNVEYDFCYSCIVAWWDLAQKIFLESCVPVNCERVQAVARKGFFPFVGSCVWRTFSSPPYNCTSNTSPIDTNNKMYYQGQHVKIKSTCKIVLFGKGYDSIENEYA